MITAKAIGSDGTVLEAFTDCNELLGGQVTYRRQRLAAAREFLDDHPDLDAWMASPIDARFVELIRRPFAWQLISFAIVSGRCRADAEFLFANNFGHNTARWITILFPNEVDRLRQAAVRLGDASPQEAVRAVLSLAVVFAGRSTSLLRVEDLDTLCTAIDTSTRLSESMRRARRGELFHLRRLLFEADMIELPRNTDARAAPPPDKHVSPGSPRRRSVAPCKASSPSPTAISGGALWQ